MIIKFIDEHREAVEIANQRALEFVAPFVTFSQPVSIKHSSIRTFNIYASYFLNGLVLEGCSVESELNWQSGAHNKQPVNLINCTFNRFVDFEDCWFMADVLISGCSFYEGTNLLGNKNTPVAVTFEGKIIIENSQGMLDKNTYSAPN